MSEPPIQEGEVSFPIPGVDKECKTYYKIVGHLSTDGEDGSKTPLLVLHGGPGAGHDYLLGLTDLVTKYSTPVIFYDQIGNGRSTHLPETAGDERFWREPLFIRELENLLNHLKLPEIGYHIFGQSWGGMLGSSFAATNPKGLRRLVLANTPSDVDLWRKSISLLRSQLPEELQKVINEAEEKKDFENPKYQEAVGAFYQKHLCLARPWPPPEVAATIRWLNEDTTVYGTMNGPSELTLTGSLTGWSVIDRLKDINIPTLVYNGDVDEAQDMCVRPFFEKIPRVRWITMKDSSHFTHVDHRDAVIKLVGDFLVQDAQTT